MEEFTSHCRFQSSKTHANKENWLQSSQNVNNSSMKEVFNNKMIIYNKTIKIHHKSKLK